MHLFLMLFLIERDRESLLRNSLISDSEKKSNEKASNVKNQYENDC